MFHCSAQLRIAPQYSVQIVVTEKHFYIALLHKQTDWKEQPNGFLSCRSPEYLFIYKWETFHV